MTTSEIIWSSPGAQEAAEASARYVIEAWIEGMVSGQEWAILAARPTEEEAISVAEERIGQPYGTLSADVQVSVSGVIQHTRVRKVTP